MRLIDADELKEQLKRIYEEAFKWRNDAEDHIRYERADGEVAAYIEAIMTVNNAPTLDAVPEREAEWVEIKGGMKYECSECNGEVFYKTKYCPNCGAKMEKEIEK